MQRVARDYAPGLALDIACGLGRHARYLAAHGWRVTALDASEVAIARLGEFPNIDARVQDLTAPDLVIEPGTYDLICDCLYVQRALLPQIRSGVRAGGLVALALPMVDDSAGLKPMNQGFLVEAGEVRSWFADWEILEYREEPEGRGRRSMAQLIARRVAT